MCRERTGEAEPHDAGPVEIGRAHNAMDEQEGIAVRPAWLKQGEDDLVLDLLTPRGRQSTEDNYAYWKMAL